MFHCEEIEQTYIIRKTVPFAQISKNDADEQFKTGVSIPKFVSSLALNFVTNLDRFAQSGRYLVEEGEIYKSLPKLTAPHTPLKNISSVLQLSRAGFFLQLVGAKSTTGRNQDVFLICHPRVAKTELPMEKGSN